jgi:transcriptional regulator GlxA family with amidase domain
MDRKRVGIFLYEDVEVLDFCGPFEVFSVTRLNEAKRREETSPFHPVLVAESAGPVTATGGMQVLPHYSLADCPHLDIVLVPGGWGFRHHLHNTMLFDWLRDRAARAETLTGVCTGAMLLGSAGLLDGRDATTHWKFLDAMREAFRAGWGRVHFSGHIGGNRHVAESRGPLLRRRHCPRDRPPHGVSVSRSGRPTHPALTAGRSF